MNRITQADVGALIDNPTLDNYQSIAGRSAVYPGQGTFMGLMYVTLKLNGEAGEFAEKVGKALRDDGIMEVMTDPTDLPWYAFGSLDLERLISLRRELGDVLWYVQAAARELDTKLSQLGADNLSKLAARTETDTLHGDGDDR